MNKHKAKRCAKSGHRVASMALSASLYGVLCEYCREYLFDALGGFGAAALEDGVRYERSGRWIVPPGSLETELRDKARLRKSVLKRKKRG